MTDEWHEKLSILLSQALNLEHSAYYFYSAVSTHFDSKKMSLIHLRDFFYKEGLEELEHAKQVARFMSQIDLKIVFQPIETSDPSGMSVLNVFDAAVAFETKVLNHYELISKEAEKNKDTVTSQFIDIFLARQIKEIKNFRDYRLNSTICIDRLGEFLFDQSFK